jgi:ferritin
MFDLLLRHINAEQYAAHAYNQIASWADAQGFMGLRDWADDAAAEEQQHAKAFIDYARTRGAVVMRPIASPPAIGGYAEALRIALEVEQAVAQSLQELASFSNDDDATETIAGDYLLKEQWPAIHFLEQALRKVQRGAPIDLLDAELFEEA